MPRTTSLTANTLDLAKKSLSGLSELSLAMGQVLSRIPWWPRTGRGTRRRWNGGRSS